MTTKHTPWVVSTIAARGHGDLNAVPENAFKCFVYENTGKIIGIALGATDEEAFAYANMIAAAPELLGALKDAENEIENAIIGLTTDPLAYANTIKQRLESSFKKAQAAIAKAEGE